MNGTVGTHEPRTIARPVERRGKQDEFRDEGATETAVGPRPGPADRARRRAGLAGGDPRGPAARGRRGRTPSSPTAPRSSRSSTARTTGCWSSSGRAASTIPRRPSTTPSGWRAQAAELRDDLCVAMRVYFEKPRTTTGWKGLINDPHLDGSRDVNVGLHTARRLLLEVTDLGPADRLRVPRPDHAAVHLRRGRLGRDRRPDDREPDPPPARLRPLDAGRVQERHGRQRQARRRRRPGRRRAARLRRRRRQRHAGDPLHGGQSRLPRDPARRPERPELRRRDRRRRGARGSCAPRVSPSGS